ncbi:two-component sensor histidine kinase [Bordetella genomosp. 10]|uniref:histidine kinase n=1 Tax=Bordetella genomosp. 10 TaxID=1416804 RepID=A0A261S1G5_9BORD|nr:ATP-binding protein [Bordetella genomosp. 10]OZI30991.1 two-component sensor histidine kinase [Bordetella genomosp. 10]
MDGFQKRLNASVQRKLSVTLSLAILAVAVVAGIVSFLSAFEEAHELQDDVLRLVARIMDRQRLSPDRPPAEARGQAGDEEARVIVQRLGQPASALGVDDGGPLPLPATLADGLYTLELSGEMFRVLVRTTAGGERVAVAQESGFRDEIARGSALRTAMPFLLLVPVLLWLVADLVRKMFRPIAALARDVDQRSEHDLHPVEDAPVPTEIRPFVVAINRLLARVARSMDAQRRFVADAAHELRSPMTALSLQAERLAQAGMPDPARERLATLRLGIERSRRLLDQMLALARAQSSNDRPAVPVSALGIYRRVLEDLMPLAEAKRIDIGVEGTQDARLRVSELDLVAMVRNLVDNAIRHTPPDGRIDLSVDREQGRAVLRVQDSGPGIASAERERVFDAFYRPPGSEQIGSGLGLAIVRAIASRIGANIRLGYADETARRGLRVEILIPVPEEGDGD